MSPDNNPLARGVCSRLDEGIDALTPALADRLTTIRCDALASKNKSVKKSLHFSLTRFLNTWFAESTRWVIPAMLVAGIMGFMGYQHYQTLQEQDESEIDLALLSSDLPLEAYLDRGFTNWIRVKDTQHGGASCGPNC